MTGLSSDPLNVMPQQIKLIMAVPVASAPIPNHTRTRAQSVHTNLVLQSEITLGLLGLLRVSLQLVQPHFKLPQALSLLSLQEVDTVGGIEMRGNMDMENGDKWRNEKQTKTSEEGWGGGWGGGQS